MAPDRRSVPIQEIQETVAQAFHLSRAEMLSRSRRQHVAYARHVAMYLSREMSGPLESSRSGSPSRTRASYPRIAKAFGRDHSSVIYACDAIDRRRRIDLAFAHLLDGLANRLHCTISQESDVENM